MQPRVNLDPSEMYTKLRSESGPSVIERQHIEATLLLCDKDYDDYEMEVTRLQSQILFIRGQQKRLKEHRQTLQSLCSPIRKLPNEILGSIFEAQSSQPNLLQEHPWCLQSQQPQTTVSSPISFLPALSASAVCTRWREAALSTPSLWSRLKLEITSCAKSPKQSNAFTDLLDLYLQRSKSCPLDIDLCVYGDHAENEKILVVSLLLQQAQRWKTFQYSGDCTIDSFIGRGIEFSILEKIVLDVFDPDGEDLFIFEKAPMLRELQTDNLTSILSGFLWDQLIQLYTIDEHNPLDRIINLFPNLIGFTIWECKNYHNTSLLTASSTFKRLRSLCIKVQNSNADVGLLEHIFSSVTFPSLMELEIGSEGRAYDRAWPKDAFKGCLTRSSCARNITKFSLRGIRISDLDLISILYSFPSLQDLFISNQLVSEDDPLTSRLISSLHSSGYNELTKSRFPIVPRLHKLGLEFGGANFDDAAFISMVSSRWLPDLQYAAKIQVDCLRAVKLKFLSRKVDHTIFSPLWYLDRMGMRVIITGSEDKVNG